jgi:ribosomal protein L29
MQNFKNLKELRDKEAKVLTKDLAFLQEKLTKLRTDLAFRKLKNIRQISATRKQIAQIWTILHEKAVLEIAKNEVAK